MGSSLASRVCKARSSPDFLNFRPEFFTEFCSECFEDFSCFVFLETETTDNHQHSPLFFNAKSPGKSEEKIHKSFQKSSQGKSLILDRQTCGPGLVFHRETKGQQLTYGVVLRKVCGNYVYCARKGCGNSAESLQTFCGIFAEHFLQWPLPERPHKWIAEKGGFVKGWSWRMCPRSGFCSGGTCERTLVPVFVPGEHPNVPSFRFSFWGNIRQKPKTTLLENHPFANPRENLFSSISIAVKGEIVL